MVESGKNIFQSHGNMAQLMNFRGYWHFLSDEGGRVSRHPRSRIAGNLNVNKHGTRDFKLSSPVTVSLM